MSFVIAIAVIHFGLVSALGINCRGSGLCPRASWNNNSPESVIQILRDAVWDSALPNSTSYNSGDHIICVSQSQPITIGVGADVDGLSGTFGLSGSIPEGGICLFPQGATLTLGQIRPLTDAILEHKCTTCGSVPIHFVDEGSNDPSDGILTFNYVQDPFCVGNCISDTGSSGPSSITSSPEGGAVTTTVVMSEAAASTEPSTTTSQSTVSVTSTKKKTAKTTDATATVVMSSSQATVTITAPASASNASGMKSWSCLFFFVNIFCCIVHLVM